MKLSESTPRLTEMEGARHPHVCQGCGLADPQKLCRWQECDHHDQPELRVVVLCGGCAQRLIEPHPRLYHRMDQNAPMPGCMKVCLNCSFRQGVSCSHPAARANGGDGVELTVSRPLRAFVDGTTNGKRTGSLVEMYPFPPASCAQFQLIEHSH